MNRREFLATTAAPLLQTKQPNILWVTCEDMSPNLGCYGDKHAASPTIDSLAERSLRYRSAWSCAPVCAPARTTIISGMYPPSTGAEHMRSKTKLAPGQKMFPHLLREAGYYTSNNSKEDYNLVHTGKVWDESSNKAHWRKRDAKQPFFSVFNYVITHESQIRTPGHKLRHDPKEVRVPAYQPDIPEVRRDWAQYYDNIQTMDGMVKKTLGELEADGLKDSTIVFFYSDHGAGMPRLKRWPYNSGLHVPMMVHIPEQCKHLAPKDYAAGGWTDRLVSFVDLAPTVLSLAGVKKPDYHQGYAFLGANIEPEQDYIFGFRGRMDERIDMVRSVRNQRYVYIRNYMPHRIYGQHVDYMFEMPTTRKWKEVFDSGKANEAQSHFWKTKPAEEFYDLQNDPDEVNNLALKPTAEQKSEMNRLRAAQTGLAVKIRDVGFLPEHEIHARAKDDAPWTMARDDERFAAVRVMNAAELATGPTRTQPEIFRTYLEDGDSAVRYWCANGILGQGKPAVEVTQNALRGALNDDSLNVRVAAAEALARYGKDSDLAPAVEVLLKAANSTTGSVYVAIAALNALTEIGGEKLRPYRERIAQLSKEDPKAVESMRSYVPRLLEYLLEITPKAESTIK
ncbi:MAG: sulfatase [Acidobacteria bacterium]|nr:sulfatase [Acidobacteriota bacterium]